MNAAAEVIYELVDPNANLIFGAVVDESLHDQVSLLSEILFLTLFSESFFHLLPWLCFLYSSHLVLSPNSLIASSIFVLLPRWIKCNIVLVCKEHYAASFFEKISSLEGTYVKSSLSKSEV